MEIFVNNLAYQIEENALREPFAQYGEVRRVTVVRDRETGKSRGFGFVDMPDPEAAQRAMAELHGKMLEGRPLMLSEARPRPPPGERPFRPAGGGGPPPRTSPGTPPLSGPLPPRTAPAGASPTYRPSAPPPVLERRGEFGDREPPGPDAGLDLQEQRRRVVSRLANAPGREKRRTDRFEEGRRRPAAKGLEKGRKSRLDLDDDDETDLPVRIR